MGTTSIHDLGQEVAVACGFPFIPPIRVRRGGGGDYNPMWKVIRVGVDELREPPDRLWYVLAHELAHAQGGEHEGHSLSFYRRLAQGLMRTGRLYLLRNDFQYRETALRVAHEYGLPGLPPVSEFLFDIGDAVADRRGRRWVVASRYRRAGSPCYRLQSPGWRWTASEKVVIQAAG